MEVRERERTQIEVRETGELGRHVRDKALGGGEGDRGVGWR